MKFVAPLTSGIARRNCTFFNLLSLLVLPTLNDSCPLGAHGDHRLLGSLHLPLLSIIIFLSILERIRRLSVYLPNVPE